MKAQFYYCDNEWSRNGFSRYGLYFSQQFCEFFTLQFTRLFFNETGLKPSSKVTLAGYKQQNQPIYEPGSVSKLNLVLWIMPEYNDDISFCWTSKTGKVIEPTHANFDEDDLECWMEGLKPSEYWKQVATEKKSHPFQISNLPYELKVFDFGVEMKLRIFQKNIGSLEDVKSSITKTIQIFNDNSEAANRKNGVVHNHNFREEADYLCTHIDTGSAGVEIIKKILKDLSKFNNIDKIEVDL